MGQWSEMITDGIQWLKIFAKNETKYQDKSRAILNYDSVIGIGDANPSPESECHSKGHASFDERVEEAGSCYWAEQKAPYVSCLSVMKMPQKNLSKK